MTRLIQRNIKCPKCGKIFSILDEVSINTMMDPELVEKFLKDDFYISCPDCHFQIHLIKEMMISYRNGFFIMSNNAPYEVKKSKLREFGIVDDQGKVLSQLHAIEQKQSKEAELDLVEVSKQKVNRTILRLRINEFFLNIHNKCNHDILFTDSDWNEYDLITKEIIEEQEMKNNYSSLLEEKKMVHLKEDKELMEKWNEIKEKMSKEKRTFKKKEYLNL